MFQEHYKCQTVGIQIRRDVLPSLILDKKASEYDQEIPQSYTADQPTAQ